jgi:ABC-type polysaccharide/polyol phosphate transport system ATPase subunit
VETRGHGEGETRGRGEPAARRGEEPAAIRVENATKLYRRYGRKRSVGSFKSALLSGQGRRAFSPDAAVPALTDVSFAVGAGETVGVVGANGSGKSTLLKLLAGIVRPTSGRVEVAGRLAALLELGAGFHPEISGRENLEISGLLLGMSRREVAARFDAIVRFAGIEEFLDAPVKTYSAGMAVRLGFAIAAHSDPDVLLVDEVLAVGDEAFAHRCLEKFSEFERAGKTLLFVSHDLALVSARCRRAIWLDCGRVAADGPATETVALYRERVAREEGEGRLAAAPAEGSAESIGSGRAVLERVFLRDGAGRETRRLRSGEPASVEMRVRAPERLSDFVFGVGISTVAGSTVLGVNTEADGLSPEQLFGEARVVLELPALDLAPGLYSLDAAVHARGGAPYDYRRDLLRFEVTAERPSLGVWSPKRRWRGEGGVRWKR